MYFSLIICIAVQIHYDFERKHWVTSSFVNGNVQLYDSLSNGSISDSLKVQLAQIYKNAIFENVLTVTIIPMQQQKGPTDCGLFSIATAFAAASGKNVSNISFEQLEMRRHLELCFGARIFSNFPASQAKYRRCSRKYVTITVHCICQNIESCDDRMIQCDKCHEWYHFKCVDLEESPDTTWFCPQCGPPSDILDDSPLRPPMPPLSELKASRSKDCVDRLQELSVPEIISKFQSVLPTLVDISTGKVTTHALPRALMVAAYMNKSTLKYYKPTVMWKHLLNCMMLWLDTN